MNMIDEFQDVVGDFAFDVESWERRLHLMEAKEHLRNNGMGPVLLHHVSVCQYKIGIGSVLLYHVNLIDLITFCTWGKIPAAELMALEVMQFIHMPMHMPVHAYIQCMSTHRFCLSSTA